MKEVQRFQAKGFDSYVELQWAEEQCLATMVREQQFVKAWNAGRQWELQEAENVAVRLVVHRTQAVPAEQRQSQRPGLTQPASQLHMTERQDWMQEDARPSWELQE